MAKARTKKRTHVGANNPKHKAPLAGRSVAQDPKSMVIRIGAGEVGSSVSQLAKDVRQVMEPGTASRLKERRANHLRDYVNMTGPLGVTHLLLFSRSESGNTNLRIATTPRGPTLHFRVEKYSLCKDVRKAQRRPRGGGKEYTTSPLLIMNNISTPGADANSKVPKHLESLTTTVFQSLFPRINPQTTPLRSIRRVLLLNREPSGDEADGSFVLNFRHYAIHTKPAGVSKQLRRLDAAEKLLSEKNRRGGVPNLGKLGDISEYIIGGENGEGYVTDGTSGSEMDTDAEVEVLDEAPRKVLSSKARAAKLEREREGEPAAEDDERIERRRVALVELGPRMKLRMTKVEEGLCSGKTMWHEHIHKSRQEIQDLEQRWEKRRQEKEARRKEQKANVERKKKERAASGAKQNKKEGEGDDGDDGGDDDDVEMNGNNSDLFDEMMDDDEFDSEGIAGDAEEAIGEQMDDDEWEDEREEIAG
ncbi:ribosome biogenesis protein-like protein Ssf2 [Durotheca rogersii]|uniref:ribosome biogenesis protein-like protein Ssf2 n=1 Tax=Durotheca rogersii TaxID=419775 RepID=UPI002220B555|nr:ribosome biogenesis protein-like protein Ssf2 [Durotheca rogersii]KAI5867368.1 ribosome biogenesis protein-like protein Ssf2 [Durotheca rogersii]